VGKGAIRAVPTIFLIPAGIVGTLRFAHPTIAPSRQPPSKSLPPLNDHAFLMTDDY